MGLAKGRKELYFAFAFASPISTNEIRPYFAKAKWGWRKAE
jgi:hypothetical protein